MSRKKIEAEKTRRKDDLDPAQDQFIQRTMTVVDWAVEHRRPLVAGAGLVLVATIVFIIVSTVLESSRAEASAALFGGVEASLAAVEPKSDETGSQTSRPSGAETFESLAARSREALARLEAAKKEHGDSTIGLLAGLGIASEKLDLGEYEAAVREYEAFLARAGEAEAWLKPQAVEGLAYALEASGNIDKALARLRDLAAQGGRLALVARYHEARLAEKKGDKDGARAALKDVIDGIVKDGSVDRLDALFVAARERLLALDPRAEVPALPGGGLGGLEGIDPAMLERLLRAQAGGEGE